MGLAYESKTPEIFRHMGLKKYQVPFTSFQTRWCDCASGLLEDLDHVRATLPDTLDRMSAGVHQALERLDAIAAGSLGSTSRLWALDLRPRLSCPA